MNRIIPFVIVMVCFASLIMPVSSQSPEESILEAVKNISITVPQTGTDILDTGESMTQYLGWLEEIADALITFSNDLLRLFGMEELNWSTSTAKVTAAPTLNP